jgi:hypothetical protein
MITIIVTAIVVTIVNRLLPYPPLDNRILAAWRWAWSKVT